VKKKFPASQQVTYHRSLLPLELIFQSIDHLLRYFALIFLWRKPDQKDKEEHMSILFLNNKLHHYEINTELLVEFDAIRNILLVYVIIF